MKERERERNRVKSESKTERVRRARDGSEEERMKSNVLREWREVNRT